jgi:hypothetical protein
VTFPRQRWLSTFADITAHATQANLQGHGILFGLISLCRVRLRATPASLRFALDRAGRNRRTETLFGVPPFPAPASCLFGIVDRRADTAGFGA